jgi:hypothetical protein
LSERIVYAVCDSTIAPARCRSFVGDALHVGHAAARGLEFQTEQLAAVKDQ